MTIAEWTTHRAAVASDESTPEQLAARTATAILASVPWAARLRERTAPMAPDDADCGRAHEILTRALALIYERTGIVWDPEGARDPGALLLDVEHCPSWALPWLAQLAGVRLPPGVAPDDARLLISDVAGWKRGTAASLAAAAGRFLTGTKTVYFRERDEGDAYRLEVVTLDTETPDPDAVRFALMRQKPAGIALIYRQVTAWDYQEVRIEQATYRVIADGFLTYRALLYKEPA